MQQPWTGLTRPQGCCIAGKTGLGVLPAVLAVWEWPDILPGADGQGLSSTSELGVGSLILAGGLGGVAYWGPVYPADVIKSRIQVDDMLRPRYRGMLDCFSQVRHPPSTVPVRQATPCTWRLLCMHALHAQHTFVRAQSSCVWAVGCMCVYKPGEYGTSTGCDTDMMCSSNTDFEGGGRGRLVQRLWAGNCTQLPGKRHLLPVLLGRQQRPGAVWRAA